MSRRSKKDAAAAGGRGNTLGEDGAEEEFVMVTPRGSPAPPSTAAGDARAEVSSSSRFEPPANRTKGTPAEEAAYEAALDAAYKADMLGLDLPPVVPPGHYLVPAEEPAKPPTFWHLLSKRAENRGALLQLYFTTGCMVCIPLGLMALGYWLFFSGLEEDSRLMWSGLLAVLGVNLVAIGFGVFAYFDNGGEEVEVEGEESESAREARKEAKHAMWSKWEAEQEVEESREDRERLATLRQLHEAKKAGKDISKMSKQDASRAEDTLSSRKSRSQVGQKDSTLADAATEEDEQSTVTSTRATRSQSKKKT